MWEILSQSEMGNRCHIDSGNHHLHGRILLRSLYADRPVVFSTIQRRFLATKCVNARKRVRKILDGARRLKVDQLARSYQLTPGPIVMRRGFYRNEPFAECGFCFPQISEKRVRFSVKRIYFEVSATDRAMDNFQPCPCDKRPPGRPLSILYKQFPTSASPCQNASVRHQ